MLNGTQMMPFHWYLSHTHAFQRLTSKFSKITRFSKITVMRTWRKNKLDANRVYDSGAVFGIGRCRHSFAPFLPRKPLQLLCQVLRCGTKKWVYGHALLHQLSYCFWAVLWGPERNQSNACYLSWDLNPEHSLGPWRVIMPRHHTGLDCPHHHYLCRHVLCTSSTALDESRLKDTVCFNICMNMAYVDSWSQGFMVSMNVATTT